MSKLTIKSTVCLYNGVEVPLLGLNTDRIGRDVYNVKTQYEILSAAIEAGIRYFDTSEVYPVYKALGKAIRKSGIPREDFFIGAKMRIDEMSDGRNYQAIDETLCQLEMDYLDLYSIPWPLIVNNFWPGVEAYQNSEYFPAYFGGWCGREISKTDNGDSEALISFYEKGLARAIGVANLEVKHMKDLLAYKRCTVKPMINQGQFHPLYQNEELRSYLKEEGIVFAGSFDIDETVQETKPLFYVDVTRFGFTFQTDDDHKFANEQVRINPRFRPQGYFDDPYDRAHDPRRRGKGYYDDSLELNKMADKYGKTVQQLLIRWSLQQGVITTPMASLRKGILQIVDVFDFAISEEDMKTLNSKNIELRIGYNPNFIDF